MFSIIYETTRRSILMDGELIEYRSEEYVLNTNNNKYSQIIININIQLINIKMFIT